MSDLEDYNNGNAINGATNGEAIGSAQPELTQLQTQYLGKILAQLAMSREWAALNEVGSLTTYGLPFNPEPVVPDKKLKKRTHAEPSQPPILRYLFRHFLLTFPGLADAPHRYWTKVVQPTFDDMASRNLPSSKERSEVTKRRTIAIALTNYIGTIFFKGLHPYKSTPARPSPELLQRIDDMFPAPQTESIGGFFVAIVKIDLVRLKPKAKPKMEETEEHEDDGTAEEPVKRVQTEQYLICTRPGDGEQEIFVYRDCATFKKFDRDLADTGVQKPALPGPGPSGFPSKENLQLYLRSLLAYIAHDPDSPTSFKLKSFLLGFAMRLSDEKRRALVERMQNEEARLAASHNAWAAAGVKVHDMHEGWYFFKDRLLAGDRSGLDKSFELLKNHSSIYDLPLQYRHAEQWASAYVAYALHYLFVSAPNANEAFYLLQILHHFFPYGIAKQLLKIANPANMIKAFMALLFGEPMGAKSLFSRVFASIEGKNLKAHKKQIDKYRKMIADNAVCDKLRAFVDASRADQEKVREKSRTDGVDIVVSILVRAGLSEAQEEDILECYHAFQDGVAAGDPTLLSDTSENSISGLQATKFKWLKRLLRLESVNRGNKEALKIWEGTFEHFFRETVALYYPVISAISKASNLSARLGDLQKFLDDMVAVVLGRDRSPRQFVQLAQRHEQSLYYLLHEIHANGKGLTEPLIEWLRKGVDFMSEGIRTTGEKPISVNLEALLAANPSIVPKVLSEIDETANYIKWNKVRYEISLRAAVLEEDNSLDTSDAANPTGSSIKSAPQVGHVDVDGLLKSLMESEGQNVTTRVTSAGAFGMVDWGYFYDPQVVDAPTETVLEGDEPPRGDGADGESVAPSTTTSRLTSSRPPRHGETSSFIKPPLLMETRKLLEAYYAQIRPALNTAADAEQWTGKVKTSKK